MGSDNSRLLCDSMVVTMVPAGTTNLEELRLATTTDSVEEAVEIIKRRS